MKQDARQALTQATWVNLCGYIVNQYKPTSYSGLSQILLSDWLSYSQSIGDGPLVVKGINFKIRHYLLMNHELKQNDLVKYNRI